MWRTLKICGLLLVGLSHAFDLPGEFVQNPSGSLALSGLPGFRSTPARLLEPGFGISYARVLEAEEQIVAAAGEFGWDALCGGVCPGLRMAFFSSYAELDSIYRQVYSEWDASAFGSWYVVGVGYGLSVEWVPGDNQWTGNRYKFGSALLWSPFALSGMLVWTDYAHNLTMDYAVSVSLNLAGRIYSFVEYDGMSLDIGSAFHFKYMTIRSSYRFPEFGVACSVDFVLGGVSVSGMYGFAGQIWDWFGISASKSVRKKTIL